MENVVNAVFMSLFSETQLKNLIADALKEALMSVEKPVSEPKDDTEKLLTRQEAASMLHCSLVSLWNFERKGLLLPQRLGRRVLYRQSDILSAISK